jgi:hypothetical protein
VLAERKLMRLAGSGGRGRVTQKSHAKKKAPETLRGPYRNS